MRFVFALGILIFLSPDGKVSSFVFQKPYCTVISHHPYACLRPAFCLVEMAPSFMWNLYMKSQDLDLVILIHLHLVALSFKSHFLHQSTIWDKLSHTGWWTDDGWSELNNRVSSANISLEHDRFSGISLTYNKNNIGPTILPWGTPE